jgi:hypothetical protein
MLKRARRNLLIFLLICPSSFVYPAFHLAAAAFKGLLTLARNKAQAGG